MSIKVETSEEGCISIKCSLSNKPLAVTTKDGIFCQEDCKCAKRSLTNDDIKELLDSFERMYAK